MSDSEQPNRQKPTRLPRPWDSPGKNTGVGCHFLLQCMKVKSEREVAQSCLTHSDPIDCSLPGSSIHGILQARALEWAAIAFSTLLFSHFEFGIFLFGTYSQKHLNTTNLLYFQICVCVCQSLSHVRLVATPWTVAHQAPPSMGFLRQEYWSEVPLPSPLVPSLHGK